jgi:predicted phage-related endonuclease
MEREEVEKLREMLKNDLAGMESKELRSKGRAQSIAMKLAGAMKELLAGIMSDIKITWMVFEENPVKNRMLITFSIYYEDKG